MYTGKDADGRVWHAFCDSMAALRREQEELKRRLNRCIQCKAKGARWNSMYCSDGCKHAFHGELRGEVR